MKPTTMPNTPLKVTYTDPTAFIQLTGRLGSYLEAVAPDRRTVVVCLGTDRSTGDSLGPLAGTALKKFHSSSFDLFGTLEQPVHARNLDETLDRIYRNVNDPFVIGIDACLGQAASIGCIQIGEGPIRPGAAVSKELTPVGDIHISGIVNVAGFMEYFVLQNTRLHVVMRMAELIARTVFRAVALTSKAQQQPLMKWM